jgi:tripartite-type tricarboxylate transporter receptor subunit TctC
MRPTRHVSFPVRIAMLLIAATGAIAGGAGAAFPIKPIRVIVPYPAGGPTDTTARVIAPHMSEALGQQLVI